MAVKRVNFGEFRERVTLQYRQGGQDVLGQVRQSWATLATVWAKVTPIRGREYFAASQMQAPIDVRILIRWREDVEPTMRVMWGGKYFEVTSVIDTDARRSVIELMCVSAVRDARETPQATLGTLLSLADGAVTLGGSGMYFETNTTVQDAMRILGGVVSIGGGEIGLAA